MERTTNELDSLLFEEDRELVNIRFLPGTDRGLTKAEMCNEAAAALQAALSSGLESNPPKTGKLKRKLEEIE